MVRIITDTTCDIVPEQWQVLGIDVVPLNIEFDDCTYKDRIELSPDDLYEKLSSLDHLPKTSQPAPGAFLDLYNKYPEEEIVVLPLSKGLSGTYQSALLAKEISEREDIYVVDTNFTSQGLRWMVYEAIKMRDEGKSASEIAEAIQEMKDHIRLIAIVDKLDYLYKGGRISEAAMLAGNFIKLHPIIGLENGKISMFSKARGKKQAVKEIQKLMKEHDIVLDKAYFGYSGPYKPEEMEDFIEEMKKGYPFQDVDVSQIGSLVGTHTGPGLKCIVFYYK
ncbi:DegV family protein [Dubosiella newyorkensis]|jgi:DegV family protein with EDD domain|uniref:Fatty acid-binding protein DegV n=2 Tax=Dubosiella newyorkensis TaxID=1862672 RepID=A0A1U7NLI9_9FIRM|nr:DegV family protein [Dubosiella newyorkensis]MCI9040521.1 DegV family protein [Dubosiella newyorkensis]OLU45596.1 hypothetical protein BO225_08090 [Dubosiella newyorkensis]